MYANLSVTAKNRATGRSTRLAAWEVTIAEGTVVVRLDAQDGEGSHAEPAGEREFELSEYDVRVVADF